MPIKKFPLPRSPLGQEPIKNRAYEESFHLLPLSHDSEQYQSVTTPRYEALSNGRDFKLKQSPVPSPRLPPLPPKTGTTVKRQHQNDSGTFPIFPSHSEESNRSFGLMEAGYPEPMSPQEYPMIAKQSSSMLRSREIEDMGALYMPPKRPCPLRCLRRFFVTFIGSLFTIALVLTCLFLATRPRSPTLQMKVLNITSFKYEQGVSGSAPQVVAGLNFLLQEENPNRQAELIYDQVRIDIKYQTSLLGSISIQDFEQRKESNSSLVIELPETFTSIEDPADALALGEEVSRLNIQTVLKGAVVGHFKMWGIRVKNFDSPVDCKVNVEPANVGHPAKLLSSSCYHYPT